MVVKLKQKKKQQIIGIDLGSYAVKAVVFEKSDQGLKLIHCIRESLPRGAINERDVDDIEHVSRTLSRIRKQIPKSFKQVAIALSGSTVITKNIIMDSDFTDDEMEIQIEMEADSLIPYPIEEVSIDFERMDIHESDRSKVNVLLSVARTEHVMARVSACEMANFNTQIVDVESYVLGSTFELCKTQIPHSSQQEKIGLIDIGAHMMLLTVIQNGEVIYTRDQSFGSDIYTKSIAQFYDKKVDEAELLKLVGNLPSEHLFDVLAPFQTRVLQQIRRALQLFATAHNEQKVEYLILSGGAMLTEDLIHIIQDELEVDCILAKPFSNVEISHTIDAEFIENQEQFMLAAGLALRGMESCRT